MPSVREKQGSMETHLLLVSDVWFGGQKGKMGQGASLGGFIDLGRLHWGVDGKHVAESALDRMLVPGQLHLNFPGGMGLTGNRT